ncbi:uncharacterized protein [Lolium perenne]|jgi:hypothetical protein|uniref:uncharacterized protein n=1 Tax=Lolium perenne TaxID=4522 RepID=UPI0021EA044E
MAMQHILLLVFIASILHAASSTSSNSTIDGTTVTAYDILEQNNLPRGLLPLGVESYVLHEGTIEVTLPGECNFFVPIGGDQYKFRYGSKVGGVIKSGSLTQVYGTRFQAVSEWLGFNTVERVGDQLTIQAQALAKSFPASAFANSPKCS